MLTFRVSGIATCVAASALVVAGSAHAAQETKTLTLDSGTLHAMKMTTGAGFLHVVGGESEKIEVLATLVRADNYRLTLEKEGDKAVLVSEIKHNISFLFGASERIDLTVKVPNRLLLEIKDGSGEIELSGMKAAAAIDDGSGSLYVKGHQGSLEIEDGSGDIHVADVTGNVRIDDSSGDIVVQNIVGDLDIRDGSGSIRVSQVDGHVTIRDGSGGIAVANVKKGLTIKEDGSGGLSTSNIDNGVVIDK